MDQKKYGNPAAKRGRQDGITKLSGSATFAGSSVTIKVSIPEGGGTQQGTSNFRMGGATGSDTPTAISNSASWNASELICTTLSGATFDSDYTVAIKYTVSSADRTLSGTIPGASVKDGDSPKITLT